VLRVLRVSHGALLGRAWGNRRWRSGGGQQTGLPPAGRLLLEALRTARRGHQPILRAVNPRT
jgi:hypothetical protein